MRKASYLLFLIAAITAKNANANAIESSAEFATGNKAALHSPVFYALIQMFVSSAVYLVTSYFIFYS